MDNHIKTLYFVAFLFIGTMLLTSCFDKFSNEEYDCASSKNQSDLMQDTWCEAKRAFKKLTTDNNKAEENLTSFTDYVRGYRLGINDARHAAPEDPERFDNTSTEQKIGYTEGYQSILQHMPFSDHAIPNQAILNSQYQNIKKEAENAFKKSGININNPILKSSYIAGYITAWGIMLSSLNASVQLFSDSSFSNNPAVDSKSEKKHPPEDNIENHVKISFDKGFTAGKESANDKLKHTIMNFMGQFMSKQGNE